MATGTRAKYIIRARMGRICRRRKTASFSGFVSQSLTEVLGTGHMSGAHKPGIAQALHPALTRIRVNVTQPGT